MSATLTHASGSYPRRTPAVRRQGPGFGERLWTALMRLGAARARPQLEQLAAQYQDSHPELAQHLRQVAREGLL